MLISDHGLLSDRMQGGRSFCPVKIRENRTLYYNFYRVFTRRLTLFHKFTLVVYSNHLSAVTGGRIPLPPPKKKIGISTKLLSSNSKFGGFGG